MKIWIMLIAGLVGMVAVASAEQGSQKKDAFWDKLQLKLEKMVPAKKTTTTTAVGGVRGAKNDSAADIYWKGKEKDVEMSDEEIQSFNRAVEAKLKGDNEQALKQFEAFLQQYPQSNFRVEGLQAAEKLRQEIAAAKETVNTAAPTSPAHAVAEPAQTAAPVGQPAATPASQPPAAADGQPTR